MVLLATMAPSEHSYQTPVQDTAKAFGQHQVVLDRLAELKADQDAFSKEWRAMSNLLLQRLDPHQKSVWSAGVSMAKCPTKTPSSCDHRSRIEQQELVLPNCVQPVSNVQGEAVVLDCGDWLPPVSAVHMPHPLGEPPKMPGADVFGHSADSTPSGSPRGLNDRVVVGDCSPPRSPGIRQREDSNCFGNSVGSWTSTAPCQENPNSVPQSPESPTPDKNRRAPQEKVSNLSEVLFLKRNSMGVASDNCILPTRRAELESKHSWLLRFTRSKTFETIVTIVIILNTMFIGFQTQVISYNVADSFTTGAVYDERGPSYFGYIQAVFTCLFLIDVGLRWLAEGFCGFVISNDWTWNIFDLAAVAIGIADLILDLVNKQALGGVAAIRVLRILRLVRVVRMMRTFTFFRELRMMVETCLNGLRSYMWCCAVIFLLLYVFGITMTTHTYVHIVQSASYSDQPELKALHDAFGTLDKSILSLFQSIAGGRDWAEFYDVIAVLGTVDLALYWLFLSFAILVVMNAVAAVFVESAMKSSQLDRDLLIKECLDYSAAYTKQMLHVFHEMDTDGSGTLTEEKIKEHLADDRVQAYFETLKLDVTDTHALFQLLDKDGSGGVEIHEFLEGCRELKGDARSLDMKYLRNELHGLKRDMLELLPLLKRDVCSLLQYNQERSETKSRILSC